MKNEIKTVSDKAGVAILVAVVTAIGSFLIAELYETDMWWQLAIGEEIIRSFSIPFYDHFTVAGFGREYHDSHWLFQVVQALFYRFWGMGGVEALMVTIWGGTFFYCYRTMRRSVSRSISSLLLFLAAMTASMRFLPRPEMATFLFIAIFYFLLQEGKFRTTGELAIFGLLQVVWANCHGLFVIGPFMALCYWGVAALRAFRAGNRGVFVLSRLLGVLVVATLITPFGIRGWEYAFLLAREASANSSVSLNTVGELGSIFSRESLITPAFWSFFVLLAVLTTVIVLSARKKSTPPERLLIVLALGIAALTGRRNMPLFALVAAPFIAEQLPLHFQPKFRAARPLALAAAIAIFAFALLPLSGKYYVFVMTPTRFGWGVTPSYYPHGLPSFLKQVGFRGNVYTSDGLGGFFMYHFYPQLLPISDGRWEVYDRQVLQAIQAAPANPLIWQKLITAYDIRGVLLEHASFEAQSLVPRLRIDSQWRLVYYDKGASFWMRSDLPGLPPPQDLAAAPSSLPFGTRVDDFLILDYFYKNMGAWELRLENLERILSFGWNEEKILESIAYTNSVLERWTDAEKTYIRIIARYPTNALALRELAFLSYWRGDIASAKSYLQRAAARDPDNQLVLELQSIMGKKR